jgi:putative ABC transport system permease protein
LNKYLDAAGIALSAIWAAKLRSLMTVLGNIVAVTSIIAVVSLIQALNASVQSAILNQAGADSFIVQQFGIVRSDEEWLKVQSNPRISPLDAAAVKRYSPLVSSVMLSSSANARMGYRSASIDGVSVTGVTQEYVNFSSYDAERGRLMSPTEVSVGRPIVVIGAQIAERLFGPDVDPIDKIVQIQGMHFRVVGVSAKRGTLLGQSQDEFAVIPLSQFQQVFGARRKLSMSV